MTERVFAAVVDDVARVRGESPSPGVAVVSLAACPFARRVRRRQTRQRSGYGS